MRRTRYILILDLFILALCAAGVYRVIVKAGFPAGLEEGIIQDVLPEARAQLSTGDSLISVAGEHLHASDVAGEHLHSSEDLGFLCNQYTIGDSVAVQVVRRGNLVSLSVPLIHDPHYPQAIIIVESIVALIFFLIGIAVILFQKKEKAARIFHHLCVSIAALILLTTGRYTISPAGLGYIIELFFQASYTLVPVFFLHFTLIFPHEKLPNSKRILFPLYLIAIIISIWSGVVFLQAAYPVVNLNNYERYHAAYTAIQIFFIALFFAGFGNIIHSYIITKEDFERRKLRWIFFGIAFGTFPYIFLTLLPQLIWSKIFVNEELSLILSIIAPISFAIAIIRYRVFDINLIFKRSTVYGIVLGAMLLVYSGIVAALNSVARAYDLSSQVPDILGALLIALLFEPLRKRVQKVVDKKFFRVSYNFYEAQRGFLDEIKFASSELRLAESVTKRTDAILSVKRIAFFTIESSTERMKLVAHQGFGFLERRGIRLEKEQLKTGLELPVGLQEKIEPGVPYEPADAAVFKRWGIALVLPMLSDERKVLGFLVLGEKRSGARFTIEDIALLSSVSVQSGLALGRIGTERELILEQEESGRLSELNKLKSYFVSSVSHDLKTPLTSIRMFAEIMREQENLPRQKALEYLAIIEGEADRLSRLIVNVLDFAKIEKGTKEYSFKPIDLNKLTSDVIHSLEYQIHSRGFTKSIELSSEQLIVNADSDAVFDAITNLITNAMKYSPPERKNITIRTAHHDQCAVLLVQDEGYGIAEKEKEHIFESFYRIDDPEMKSAGGAGLGLSLVKHTMDAHHGKVEVRSEVGKGSIFALYFPID